MAKGRMKHFSIWYAGAYLAMTFPDFVGGRCVEMRRDAHIVVNAKEAAYLAAPMIDNPQKRGMVFRARTGEEVSPEEIMAYMRERDPEFIEDLEEHIFVGSGRAASLNTRTRVVKGD